MARKQEPPPPKKKTGRPATGQDPLVALRLSPGKRQQVEAWAAAQPDKPSFSEAVRRLIDMGLLSAEDS
jgi:hypothetical protein